MNDQQEQQSQKIPQPPTSSPPPNYLVWAIITTLLCCLPFGIVSIIFAAQVNSRWQAGDIEGAKSASKNAKIWAWVAFGAAIMVFLIWSLLAALGIIAGIGLGVLDELKF